MPVIHTVYFNGHLLLSFVKVDYIITQLLKAMDIVGLAIQIKTEMLLCFQK